MLPSEGTCFIGISLAPRLALSFIRTLVAVLFFLNHSFPRLCLKYSVSNLYQTMYTVVLCNLIILCVLFTQYMRFANVDVCRFNVYFNLLGSRSVTKVSCSPAQTQYVGED